MSQNIQPVEYTASNDPVTCLAERYGMIPGALYDTLRKTVFAAARSEEEFQALCLIAKTYNLNPITKEIYAFPSKGGGVVPLVGVDGYISMMQRNPDFDGMDFRFSEETVPVGNIKNVPTWIEVVIHKKSCTRPVIVREYFDECFRPTEPWKTHPRRMLRHKAVCQGARMAFGFSGIYAEADEAEPVTVQATVHDVRDVNAAIDQALEAQPKPAPKPAPKSQPAPKKVQKQAPIVEQVSLTQEPPQADPQPQQEPAPVDDSRASADIDEAYFDYVEGGGMDISAADGVCRQLVSGGACTNMTEARRLFVEKQYTI